MTSTNSPTEQSPDGYVRSHVADGIGRIEFFHPKSNSLPSAVLQELAATVTNDEIIVEFQKMKERRRRV